MLPNNGNGNLNAGRGAGPEDVMDWEALVAALYGNGNEGMITSLRDSNNYFGIYGRKLLLLLLWFRLRILAYDGKRTAGAITNATTSHSQTSV